MLTHISIKDLVIVKQLELEFHAGMHAMTGETGAGKSILIDALGLTLGDKADATSWTSPSRWASAASKRSAVMK